MVASYPLEVQEFLCPVGKCVSQKLKRKQTNVNKIGRLKWFLVTISAGVFE